MHIYFPLIPSGQLQKLIDSDSNGERNASSSHYDETDEYIKRMTSKSSSLTATAEARQQDQDAIVSNSGTADKTTHENILTFSAVQRLNWDVIFLLGGGFALSKVRTSLYRYRIISISWWYLYVMYCLLSIQGFEEAGLTQWLAGM